MSKSFLGLVLAGLFLTQVGADAKSLNAELVMSGGRSWKGQVKSRDGDDWIVFLPAKAVKPLRLGAGTIQEIIFEVDIDADKLNEMKQNREYKRVINALEKTMEPFSAYSDIPSNLTKYNLLLMEMYYRAGSFDKSLSLSSDIAKDDRDPVLQKKSRIYQVLSLIDSGDADQAAETLSEYGWDEALSASSEPAMLYLAGKLFALKKEYSKAMERVAQVIAFNSQDPDWMQPAELLCAELYAELGRYDSAEEVIRQISMLYKDTEENDKAQELKIRIDKIKADMELNKSLETEDA